MDKYIFTSGSIRDAIIEGDSIDEVFEKVVNANPDAKLGVCFSVLKEGEPEEEMMLASTIHYLHKFGRWEGEIPPAEKLAGIITAMETGGEIEVE
jgi:hypothetical protein